VVVIGGYITGHGRFCERLGVKFPGPTKAAVKEAVAIEQPARADPQKGDSR